MIKARPPRGGSRQSASQRSCVIKMSSVRQPQHSTSILVEEYWSPATRRTTQEESSLAWAAWSVVTSPPAWVLLAAWAAWRASSSRPHGQSTAVGYTNLDGRPTVAEALGPPSYITPAERWAVKNLGPRLELPTADADLGENVQVRIHHQN